MNKSKTDRQKSKLCLRLPHIYEAFFTLAMIGAYPLGYVPI